MKKFKTTIYFAIAVAALVLAACSSGSATSSKIIKVSLTSFNSSLGQTLALPDGKTIYFLEPETTDHILCSGQCLKIWPPVEVKPNQKFVLPSNLKGTIEVIKRKEGFSQLVIQGHLAYTYSLDKSKYDVLGNGVKNVWFAFSASSLNINSSGSMSPGSQAGGTSSSTSNPPMPGSTSQPMYPGSTFPIYPMPSTPQNSYPAPSQTSAPPVTSGTTSSPTTAPPTTTSPPPQTTTTTSPTTTTTSPPSTTTTTSCVPPYGGGDHDADNYYGSNDGDGCNV